MHTILLVDDERNLLEVLAVALENMGYEVITAESAEDALQILARQEVHLVLTDLRLPGLNGRQLLEKVQGIVPGLPVVIMTAYASLKDAVEIIKEGAFDYIVKPFDLNALEATVASALRFYAVSSDNTRLRQELGATFSPALLVGESPVFKALLRSVHEVSQSNANVLITGESGTGKEMIAKAIHYSSARSSGPLVTINCAAIPEQLLESELFGHVKGSFTGALANRTGRFLQADTGTLFLDEIGDMPLALQAKILRALQEKTIEPLGAQKSQLVDVRIIAATNHDLATAIARGTFRQDLYYRLNVYPIVLPPLRERKGDVPLLIQFFAQRLAQNDNGRPLEFTETAMAIMEAYSWPGNVRELENCLERLHIIAAGSVITPERLAAWSIPEALPASSPASQVQASRFPLDLDTHLMDVERELILKALEHAHGVQVKAAELLGISERSMWHRIKKLGITISHKKEFH